MRLALFACILSYEISMFCFYSISSVFTYNVSLPFFQSANYHTRYSAIPPVLLTQWTITKHCCVLFSLSLNFVEAFLMSIFGTGQTSFYVFNYKTSLVSVSIRYGQFVNPGLNWPCFSVLDFYWGYSPVEVTWDESLNLTIVNSKI